MRKVYIALTLFAIGLYAQAQIQPKIDSLATNNINLKGFVSPFNVKDVKKEIQKKIIDSFLAVKNLVLSPLLTFAKSPFVLENAEVFYGGSYDNNFLGSPAFLSNGIISVNGSLLGVPIQIVNRNGNWVGQSNENFSIQFDRETYLKQLKNSFTNKLDKQKILRSISDPLLDLKRSAEQSFQTQIAQINTQYQNILTGDIRNLGDFDKMISSDMSLLRNQILSSTSLGNLSEQQALFEQLKSKKDLGENIDTLMYNVIKNNINKAEATTQLIETVESFKKKWQSSGLLTRIMEFEGLKQTSLQKALSDPSTIVSLAKNHLNLNSFQRLFLKVNKLNLGQNTMSGSSLSFQNFLNTGAMTEFLNKGKSVLLMMGKTKDGASISDLPFSNSVFSNSLAKAIQFGKTTENGNIHISFANFQEGFSTIGNLSGLNQFRQSFVTTISKDFSIGRYGFASAEVSRSVSSYNSKAGDPQANNLQKLLSSDNLNSNTAINLSYRDEYPGIGLIYQIHVKKVALGYDNPGNPFLNNGSDEAGLTLRKSFFDKKFQLMIRNNIRKFNYSQNTTNRWRSNYSVFDVKWKLNRSSYLSLRYLPNRMVRFDDSGKHRATTLDYLSVDGNFTKKVAGYFYNLYTTVLFQKNQFASGSLNYDTKNIGIVVNQSLAVKKLLFYWNTQLNRSQNNSQLIYLNSSFNSEIGTSLNILRTVSLSSSISYNAINKWYNQLGIREGLDFTINQQISVSGFIDLHKNLRLYEPLIFGLVRGSVQVHYNFK